MHIHNIVKKNLINIYNSVFTTIFSLQSLITLIEQGKEGLCMLTI